MTKEYTVVLKFGLINRSEIVLARAVTRKSSRHRLSELYVGNCANGAVLFEWRPF